MLKIGRRTGHHFFFVTFVTVDDRMLLAAVISMWMGVILTNCLPEKLEARDKQNYDNIDCGISGSRRMENENKLENIDDSNSIENGTVYENEIEIRFNEEEFSSCPPDQMTDDYFNGNNSDSDRYPSDSKLPSVSIPKVASLSQAIPTRQLVPTPADQVMAITVPQTIPGDKFQSVPIKHSKSILSGSPKSIPVQIPQLIPMTIPKPTTTEISIRNPVRLPENIPLGIPQLIPYVVHKSDPDGISKSIPIRIPESIPFEIPAQRVPILIGISRSILLSPSAPMSRTIAIPIGISRPIQFSLLNDRRSFILPIQLSQQKSQMISVSMPQTVDRTVSHPRSIIIDASNENGEDIHRSESDVDLEQEVTRK